MKQLRENKKLLLSAGNFCETDAIRMRVLLLFGFDVYRRGIRVKRGKL